MVKAYLRYEAGLSFGVIASLDCNICFNTSGSHLLSPALDSLGLWNLRQGVCTKFLAPDTTTSSTTSSGIPSSRRGSSLLITSIASSRDASSPSSATGHADGSIRLWDCERGVCDCTLNGHKGAVTAMRYNSIGSLLASGSKDNDVILWDLVGEVGLFRLHGHHDQVTDIVFLDSGKKLVSCSKDKFMRVWDLDTQHCVQIVGGHHSEIWSLDVDPEERYLVTGSSDLEIRFYQIRNDEEKAGTLPHFDKKGDTSKSEPVVGKWEVLKPFGEIQRQCKDRVATVRFNIYGNLLACQAAGRIVEFYSVLGEADSKRKAKKRIRRKEKKLAKGSTEVGDDEIIQDAIHPTVTVADIFKPLHVLRASKKICSITFSPINSGSGSLATLALSLNNNTLEAYSIQSNATTKTHTIELPGHRSDIRSIALSSDSTLLMSTSHNNVKFWNPGTGSCLRTVDSGYGLCCSFVPGNRFALVGTKTGGLEIVDVGSGNRTEIEAHTDSIRSIASIPDGSGFVTGSADRDIKFWEYQLKQKSSHLLVTNVRTLKLSEDVQVVCISPDAKYIAAAILDSSVRVFFMDSLKFFLSLYGHKLPVLCMDISSDGALIVTGSADKNVKIWGLDFGDCHKSIFAHADSVMAVQFVRNTHYFFSVGKDRLLKYWDADKFELLLTLDGHHAEVWCLATSHRGDFVITGSHDRSIRRWDRTEEPFFIEEEREKRLEEMFEVDLENSNENKYAPKDELPEEGLVGMAGKKTQETLTAADLIVEAIDLAEEELKHINQHKEDKKSGVAGTFQPNIMMRGRSPSEHVLHVISTVHANDIEHTLLAANPGAAFEDFIRWHSPVDWETDEADVIRTSLESEIGPSRNNWPPRGKLSKRMSDQGNSWRQIWNDSPSLPASLQKPILDPIREGEKVLHYLETLRPRLLLEQIICTAFRVSLDTLNQTSFGNLKHMKTKIGQLYQTVALNLKPLRGGVFLAGTNLPEKAELVGDLRRLCVVFGHIENLVVFAASVHRKLINTPRLSEAIFNDYFNFYLPRMGSGSESICYDKEFVSSQKVNNNERERFTSLFPPPTANQSWRKVLNMGNLLNGHEPVLREIVFSVCDQVGSGRYETRAALGTDTHRMYACGTSNDLEVALSVISWD